MGVHAGIEKTWASQTNTGRTHIATKGIVQSGLVLNLDAGASTSYPGSGTTWTDLSGGGNTGTLTNGPTYNSANGGFIGFDGSNAYVDFGNNATLYNAYNTTFTQEFAVILISGASTSRTIFRVDDWSRISTQISTSSISFTIGYSSPIDSLAYSATINYNQWYLITTVWTKLNTQQIYLNGTLVAQRTPTISNYTGVTGTSGGANLGRGHTSPYTNNINANIAFFRHYNRALSAAEISQNFNATRGRFGI
jgi:hypothetical protein